MNAARESQLILDEAIDKAKRALDNNGPDLGMVIAEKAQSATEQLKAQREAERQEKLVKQQEFVEQFNMYDWKTLPPPIMSQILTRIPRRGKQNEPDWYLSPEQALVFALRCFELGLSPLSDDVFFQKETWKVGVATSGKRRLARVEGLNLSPPQFKRLTRPWPGNKKLHGLPEDVGFECRMVVNGDSEHPATYTAWISEWSTGGGVWVAKPEHMCQVRAYEKCLTFASGSGISAMPDEQEIEAEVPEVVTAAVGVKS